MEEATEFLESLAAAVLFCLAVWLLFLQLKSLPGGIFPEEADNFGVVYVFVDH